MKVIIKVGYNNAYKWYNDDNYYVIGKIYYNGKWISDKNFIEILKKNFDKLEEFLKDITGFFAIIIKLDNQVMLISDVMRTFPLFYQKKDEMLTISDNIESFDDLELDNEFANELIELRYVVKDNTIYKNIYQLESNTILIIDTDLKKKNYYNFNSINRPLINEKELITSIDTVFNKAITKLIQYANGRTLVIPLSGGYDSRQILLSLHKQKYKNIICYTYGKKVEGEVLVSKKLAEYLDYQWVYINYKNSKMKKLYYDKKTYRKVATYLSRGYSSPLIQEWYAMDYLTKNKLIPRDAIIVPGFTGDALAGSHLEENYFNKKVYNKDDILKKIIDYNYIVYHNFDKKMVRMNNVIDITKEKLNLEEAVNCYNKYDFGERQVKYITNAIRIYDYHGHEWYLPFWDKEYIELWKSIPLKYKFDRNLLKKYFSIKYNDIMKNVPIYQKKERKRTKNIVRKLYNLLMLYYNDNMNLYGYYKYRVYLHQILFNKKSSYDYVFSNDYIKFIKKERRK